MEPLDDKKGVCEYCGHAGILLTKDANGVIIMEIHWENPRDRAYCKGSLMSPKHIYDLKPS